LTSPRTCAEALCGALTAAIRAKTPRRRNRILRRDITLYSPRLGPHPEKATVESSFPHVERIRHRKVNKGQRYTETSTLMPPVRDIPPETGSTRVS
jgi:hypothetical protein